MVDHDSPPHQSDPPDMTAPTSRAMSRELSRAPIYLVDDDAPIVQATQFLLETQGAVVHTFTSPVEFLEAARASKGPGCVLLDMSMPQMSGLCVQQELATAAPHLAVVIMTGCATYANCADAMRLGAIDIVEKPFHGADFATRVVRYIDAAIVRWEENCQKLEFKTRYGALTLREREVYSLLLEGLQTKQLAFRLDISVSTAEKHVRNVLRKFHVDSPVRLILSSVQHGDLMSAE